jgi:hypothetical protein
MAPQSSRGVPQVASVLMKATTQPEPAEAEYVPGEDDQDQGRGPDQGQAKPRTRRRTRATLSKGEKTTPRKLILPDSVFDRLQLLSIKRRQTVSAIVADLLDRNLPHLRIEQDG